MKISELFSEKFEIYAKLYGATETTFETIRRKKSAERYNFFACFNRLTGEKCVDVPKTDRKGMETFAKTIGNTLRFGAVLWFSNRFRDGFIIVDADNWKRVYGLLLPFAPLTEEEKALKLLELDNKHARDTRRENREAVQMFADAQPENRYKKMNKRGFRKDWATAKHNFETLEYDKHFRRQAESVFGAIGAKVGGIRPDAENARFYEARDRRENGRKPVKVAFAE